jgi:hypothetical protein
MDWRQKKSCAASQLPLEGPAAFPMLHPYYPPQRSRVSLLVWERDDHRNSVREFSYHPHGYALTRHLTLLLRTMRSTLGWDRGREAMACAIELPQPKQSPNSQHIPKAYSMALRLLRQCTFRSSATLVAISQVLFVNIASMTEWNLYCSYIGRTQPRC